MENQLSRYGTIARSLGVISPGAKFFFVGPSSAAWYGDFLQAFGPDASGSNRVFSNLETCLNDANVVASRGDVIFLLPGFTATVSTATTINLDKAGVKIIGIGEGTLRPTITLDTATTATLPVTAANISISNVIFTANFADIVAFFTPTAVDLHLDNCLFKATATNMNAKYIVDTNTTDNSADGLKITNCKWIEPDAATVSACKVDATQDRWTFKNNFFNLSAVQASGGSLFVIATGKILTNVDVQDNYFRFIGGDLSGAGVVFTTDQSTNTGVFARNYVQHTDTASEIFGTASSGFSFFENRMSGVAGATGYVLPAVDS